MKNGIELIFILPNFGKGGAERVVSIVSPEFLKMGYRVKLLLLFGEEVAYQLPEAVEVEKMGLLSISKAVRILKIRKVLITEKKKYCKIIIIPFLKSILNTVIIAKLLLKVPVIASERSNPYLKGGSLMNRFLSSIPFFFSKRAVFQTNEARKYYFITNRKSKIIPNPILITSYQWKGNLEELKLITTCRLHPSKNLIMMVDVVDKLKEKFPGIVLYIYGDGPLKDEIEEYISKKKITDSVILSGSVDNIYINLSKASVFISTSDYEGISNSMLEAMSVGMPIVCTDCPIGGAKMMLKDGCGMLSPVGDVETFAANLDYILSHPTESAMMARKAQQKTMLYSPKNIAMEWKKVFDSL